MKILILLLQYPPDVNSTGQLMGQLAETWVSHGHEVSVITSFPHYEQFRVWPEYRGKVMETTGRRESGRREAGEHESKHRASRRPPALPLPSVTRVWVYANGTKTMLNRLASYLSFNLLAAVAGVMMRDRWDVIFCPNGSFFNGLTGCFLSRARVPVVYNIQDLYPDVPIHAGKLANRFAISVLRNIEMFMYRRAAHVTGISPSITDAVRSKGIEGRKTSTIPNFVDTGFIRPLPKTNCVSRRFGLAEKFVVMHAGYVGYAYDLDTLLRAAAIRKEPDILFVIVGNGVARDALERKARALELTNVLFLPFQPHRDLPWLRAAADVQVSLHKRGSGDYSMPSKVYEIMASCRPLLASSDEGSDVWNLVDETSCGVCIAPGQPEKLADTILELYRNPALRAEMGERGREHAVEHCSKEVVAVRYVQLFEKLVRARERKA